MGTWEACLHRDSGSGASKGGHDFSKRCLRTNEATPGMQRRQLGREPGEQGLWMEKEAVHF